MKATITTFVVLTAAAGTAVAREPTGQEIVAKVLEVDPWGLQGARMASTVKVRDERDQKERKLNFTGISKRHSGQLTKSIIRLIFPADVAGMGFLQIQNATDDDDRYLYLPELKKSRRIAGRSRSQSFMGTDYSFADIDRRDLRHSKSTVKGEEDLMGHRVWRVIAIPTSEEAEYAKMILWVRKDNGILLKQENYNGSGTLLKTQTTKEIRRVDGQWFMTRTTMQDHQRQRSTDVILTDVEPKDDTPDGEFSVRNLEKF